MEAYPFNQDHGDDAGNFRGPRPMFEDRGFAAVETRERYTVVRKTV